MPPRQNHALVLAYDGRPYKGFQPQAALPTVGGVLAAALRRLDIGATPFGASRTDAGVHALGQVASFQSRAHLDLETLRLALNDTLPSTVRVRRLVRAPPSFHAHWSSIGKVYRYRIAPSVTARLSLLRLEQALALIESRPDVSALSASRLRDGMRPRTLHRVRLLEATPELGALLEIAGPGFGRYLVRNLVAAAVACAGGEASPDALLSQFAGEAPHPFRAPAEGLCLWRVLYPEEVDPFETAPVQRGPGHAFDPPFLECFATAAER